MRPRIVEGRVYVRIGRLAGREFTTVVFADELARDGMVNLNGYWRPLANPVFKDCPSYLVPRGLA